MPFLPVKYSGNSASPKLALGTDPRSRDLDDILRDYLARSCGPFHFFGVVYHYAPIPFAIAQDDIDNLVAHSRLRQAAQVIHPSYIEVQSHAYLSEIDCGPDAAPADKSSLNSTSTSPPAWLNFGAAAPQRIRVPGCGDRTNLCLAGAGLGNA